MTETKNPMPWDINVKEDGDNKSVDNVPTQTKTEDDDVEEPDQPREIETTVEEEQDDNTSVNVGYGCTETIVEGDEAD